MPVAAPVSSGAATVRFELSHSKAAAACLSAAATASGESGPGAPGVQVTEGLRTLLDLFRSHIERPENTVRRQWQVGDVAIRDNRATQHYGVDDSDAHERRLRRVTIDGDLPVGVDGRSSTLAA